MLLNGGAHLRFEDRSLFDTDRAAFPDFDIVSEADKAGPPVDFVHNEALVVGAPGFLLQVVVRLYSQQRFLIAPVFISLCSQRAVSVRFLVMMSSTRINGRLALSSSVTEATSMRFTNPCR